MNDEKIIEMLFERDEAALAETQAKYGAFCHTVASNILSLREDREECLNDLLLALWNAIPPEKPQCLKAYIAKIVRNLAMKKTRSENVWRRCKSFAEIGEEIKHGYVLLDQSFGREDRYLALIVAAEVDDSVG